MDRNLFEAGLTTRSKVLGKEYVDKSLASADDFSRPMQELVTSYCWGEVWNRPGLDHRSRSILNLGMLIALNRHHEFKLHVKGALNNGLTRQEIQEIVLQASIYCGVPAGVESTRLVREAFAEIDGG